MCSSEYSPKSPIIFLADVFLTTKKAIAEEEETWTYQRSNIQTETQLEEELNLSLRVEAPVYLLRLTTFWIATKMKKGKSEGEAAVEDVEENGNKMLGDDEEKSDRVISGVTFLVLTQSLRVPGTYERLGLLIWKSQVSFDPKNKHLEAAARVPEWPCESAEMTLV